MRSMLVLLFLVLTTPALATDGVLEINQSCAENEGCFAGDGAGLPVTITASGSYQLTSDLSVPASTDGLSVSVDGVTIDLNGFSIVGTNSCTGTPVSACTAPGVGFGIRAEALTGITIRSGEIRRLGSRGISTFNSVNVLVDSMRIVENGNDGIAMRGGVVRNSLVVRNRFSGIAVAPSPSTDRILVLDNFIRGNGSSGINTLAGGTIVYDRNLIMDNLSDTNGGTFINIGNNRCTSGACP